MGGRKAKRTPDLKVLDKGKYYDCIIKERSTDMIKVHYMNWSSNMDEWIDKKSDRLCYGDKTEPKKSSGSKRGREQEDDPSSAIDGNSSKRLCSQQDVCALEHETRPVNFDTLNDSIRSTEELIDSLNEMLAAARRAEGEDAGRQTLQQPHTPPVMEAGPTDVLGAVEAAAAPSQHLPSADPLNATGATGAPAVAASVIPESFRVAPETSLPQCRFCGLKVLGKVVSCGECQMKFHPDTRCLGVAPAIVGALFDDVDGALTYKCCHCRLSVGLGDKSSMGSEGVNQLLCILGELSRDIRELKSSYCSKPRG